MWISKINLTLLLLLLLPYIKASSSSLSESLQTALHHYQRTQNYQLAATTFDAALLSSNAIRNDLPISKTFYNIFISAGRSHYNLVQHQSNKTLHLQHALLYFQAALHLDMKASDSQTIIHLTIDIYTQMQQYDRAKKLFQHATQEYHNHPEVIYNHALWTLKHRHEQQDALTLFEKAIHAFLQQQFDSLTLHSGLIKKHYLLGLILHEHGKLAAAIDDATPLYGIGVEQQLWQESNRRFVSPLPHPYFPSVPGKITPNEKIYPTEDVNLLLSNYKMIQKEILQVDMNLALKQKSSSGYEMEGENLHASGSWKMLKFTSGNGEINKEICNLLPFTCKIVLQMKSMIKCLKEKCRELFVYVSKLSHGTNIPAHCGPTHKRLRMHLPLKVVGDGKGGECCAIQFHGEIDRGEDVLKEYWKEGEVLVFDDSYEHSVVWEKGMEDRIVLIVDVFHPSWLEMEREMVRDEL